ncbi:MAG TPA: hypothetical protein VF950_01120 [Planctomycetota bacterium]
MTKPLGRSLALAVVCLSAAGCAGIGSTTRWPAPGYVWLYPDSNDDLSTRWKPGIGHWENGVQTIPNIRAGHTQDQWFPEPGYAWARLDSNGNPIPGELDVRWKPGQSYWELGSVKFPNLLSANEVGRWWPAPGYVWTKVGDDGSPIPGELHVQWRPGRAYFYLGEVKWPHVVASSTEGSWIPETGYGWVHLDRSGNPIPGKLQVASRAELDAARAQERAQLAQENALQERWAAYLKEIQSQNDYRNWSKPPHDLYLAERRK